MITNLRFFFLKKGFETGFRRSVVYKAPICDEKREEIAKKWRFLVQTIAICVLTIDFSQSDPYSQASGFISKYLPIFAASFSKKKTKI
ncbi:MAG: hypothetical protein Q7W13_09780 [Bacteroidia bacterium]|nr:hypothetical protein [Bacteroidia bacterium]